MTSFAQLGLSKPVLKAIERLNYTEPTPVQEQAIPLVLEGRDIIAAAKTGTGKTAAFALPCMDILPRGAVSRKPRMLVITPTRELATQITDVCMAIAKTTHHRIGTVVGGVNLEPQIQRLLHGVEILVATPGRLIDLMNQDAVDLSAIKILVLDEADRMLDMGFMPQVKTIVDATPSQRQTLLFSATVDKSIMKQVGSMLHDAELVQIATKGETADTVEQYVAEVPHALKPEMLTALLHERGHQRIIVFARTRHRADAACRKLLRAGFKAEAIHSDRSQNQRKRALDNFASGAIDILVATDVLARGIDVEGVSYVVNYDLPTQAEDYVHRIGRTGRAGANGFAISFVSPENAVDLKAIESFIKRSIPRITVEGFDLEMAAGKAAERSARAAARKDPELAAVAREYAKKQRKKEKARSEAAASSKQKAKGTSARGKKSALNASTKSSKTPRAKSAKTNTDMRPGRAHRAAVAQQRRKKRA